jgi:hypothetical protein
VAEVNCNDIGFGKAKHVEASYFRLALSMPRAVTSSRSKLKTPRRLEKKHQEGLRRMSKKN